MFQFITKFAAVYAITRWLKPRWKVLVATVFTVLTVNYLHAEYLSYVEVSENTTYLVTSYLLKFSLNAVVLLGGIIRLRSKSPSQEKVGDIQGLQGSNLAPSPDDGFDFLRGKKTLDSRSEKILKKKADANSSVIDTTPDTATISASPADPNADDGFDFLREKKALDSRSDKILKK